MTCYGIPQPIPSAGKRQVFICQLERVSQLPANGLGTANQGQLAALNGAMLMVLTLYT